MNCDSSINRETGGASAKCDVVKEGENTTVKAGVFASNKAENKPVTTGAHAQVKVDNHSLSVHHEHTPKVGSTTTTTAQANFKPKGQDVSVTASHTRHPKHDEFGVGVKATCDERHEAAVEVKHVPKVNMTTVNAASKVNLVQSKDVKVNAVATASRHMSGPSRGHSNFGAGISYSFKF
ncbi:hypothetical protein KR044_006659 [Drosophila immigrans]|nr:hypothetical protein KR044_006659 [Drosophila immigrans]